MERLRGGTLFSGIGAPECAAPWIDWRWSAEIDPFASAVHKARFPDIPNLGDVTEIDPDAIEPVDLVVFGSPCQDFSVAGQRRGMDGARGNLTLAALDLVGRLRPRWLVFENVPGLLSNWSGEPPSDLAEGEERQAEQYSDFAAFLGAVRECGYLGCWRVLDAQHFGVPQRRRRIFFVGHLGDWRPAAAVLFEPESLRGDTAPRRETGERVAASLTHGVDSGGKGGYAARRREDDSNIVIPDALTAHSITGRAGNASRQAGGNGNLAVGYRTSSNCGAWETGDKTDVLMQGTDRTSYLGAFGGNRQSGPLDVATAVNAHGGSHCRLDFESETFVCATRGQDQNGLGIGGDSMFTLDSASQHAVAFKRAQIGKPYDRTRYVEGQAGTLSGYDPESIALGMTVRRLTPRECERLQGFADDFTLVQYRGKPAADGPRYRAIGNSMAVPVMRWILRRIDLTTERRRR